MKTAVSILQEMMVKLGDTPEYECISQSGPQHQALFEYRCIALGAVVTAAARSKKEAKQEAARIMLKKLATLGHPVSPPYGLGVSVTNEPQVTTSLATDTRSYVALLKELCEEYRLGAVQYELVGDTGPPHLRHFTMRARLGLHERIATSTTKKMARQLAAEQLYKYLRENLSRVTRDFVEEDALVRARLKATERFVEQRSDDAAIPKPDLGQRVSEYHLGLTSRLEDEARILTNEALEACRDHSPERGLTAVAAALGVTAEYAQLDSEKGEALQLLELSGCTPPLTFGHATRAGAAAAALEYIRLTLSFPSLTCEAEVY